MKTIHEMKGLHAVRMQLRQRRLTGRSAGSSLGGRDIGRGGTKSSFLQGTMDISDSKKPGIDIKKVMIVIMGTIIYSAGIGLFLDPNSLAPGGVMGISIILSHTIGGAVGTWYLLLNIPLIIFGLWSFGGAFVAYTFIAILSNSIFANIFASFPQITDNLLTASIAGSILVGAGLGIVMRAGATTGGMDIVVKYLRRRNPAVKTGTLFVIADVIVVALSGIVFGDFNLAMYAFITVVLNGRVMDYILYGSDEARLIYIVSDKAQELLPHLLEEMEMGATILEGKGAYSSRRKDIIMCVVKKRRAPRLNELVKERDPAAFMVITSANEIYGEGYKNIRAENV